MKTKLATFVEFLRASYWFVPTLMSLLAVGLAIGMLTVDQRYAEYIPTDAFWLYGGGYEGARSVLSEIVGSMISVISVVFSITIVVLTLAAGQFGSRILRSFLRDRGNQITLGTFIATFIYALLVLRTIRGVDEQEFVPALSVTIGIVLVLISVGVLIYFIHHVATSIQADTVIRSIAQELNEAIDRIYPEQIGKAPPGDVHDPEALFAMTSSGTPARILASRDDYLQAIDHHTLQRVAYEHDLVIKITRRPGHFVIAGTPLAEVWFNNGEEEALQEKIAEAFLQGRNRTMHQDAEFGIQQLVEIAVRALSPGINDPFTAMTCIDRLSAALSRLAKRNFPSRARFDKDGELRILSNSTSFSGLVDSAFNQIRQNAGHSAAVLIRLLEGLEAIAERARTEEQRAALRTHAQLILDAGLEELQAEADQQDLRARYAGALRAIELEETEPGADAP